MAKLLIGIVVVLGIAVGVLSTLSPTPQTRVEERPLDAKKFLP